MTVYSLTALGVLGLLGGLAAVKGAQLKTLIGVAKAREKAGPPPETVATALASGNSWEGAVSSVGTVTASKGVAISADVAGIVRKIRFESGAHVRQGAVLVELDSSVEHAQLATALSRRKLASQNAERTRSLSGKGALSQQQIDTDEAALETASTEAAAVSAQIARKTIRAPFSGKLGLRGVNLGQFLTPGTPITVLEAAEAVYVDFSVPQQRIEDVRVGMPVRISVEGAGKPQVLATVTAVDPTVDDRTRSLKLRATLPAEGESLRPGMFVKVALVLPTRENVIIAPGTAIVHAPYGDSVFVVENRRVRQQFVRVGETRGDLVSIIEGVQLGQELVVAGGFKLRNGTPVVVDNAQRSNASGARESQRPENR